MNGADTIYNMWHCCTSRDVNCYNFTSWQVVEGTTKPFPLIEWATSIRNEGSAICRNCLCSWFPLKLARGPKHGWKWQQLAQERAQKTGWRSVIAMRAIFFSNDRANHVQERYKCLLSSQKSDFIVSCSCILQFEQTLLHYWSIWRSFNRKTISNSIMITHTGEVDSGVYKAVTISIFICPI